MTETAIDPCLSYTINKSTMKKKNERDKIKNHIPTYCLVFQKFLKDISAIVSLNSSKAFYSVT